MVTNNNQNKSASLLGVGFDNKDGHRRLTKGDNFYICGGSEETHGRMVETSIKFNEKLDAKGKKMHELSKNEFVDMMMDSSS